MKCMCDGSWNSLKLQFTRLDFAATLLYTLGDEKRFGEESDFYSLQSVLHV